MQTGKIILGVLVLALVVGIGYLGYSQYLTPVPPTPTPEPVSESEPIVVSAEGRVLPCKYVTLGFKTGGTVMEVLVEAGDEVAAGDVLVRLDPTDVQLAVQQAEAALETARAQLALLKAGPRPEQVAAAEAQLEAAQAALAQAVAHRDQLKSGALEAESATARAQVAAAQAEQRAAREAHDQTMKCYDVGGREVCPALGTPEEQARYNLYAADEALAAARAQLDALVAGADDRVSAAEAAVWAAAAQRDTAQAQLALLRAGATAEEIAIALAQVEQARSAVAQAQSALNDTVLVAPFAGTIGDVMAKEGEMVAPGQPVIVLGDLTALKVETYDLGDEDIGRVAVGQTVEIMVDALPEAKFHGRVSKVAPMAVERYGDTTFTVTIELDEGLEAGLRWGMTAYVDIMVD